MQANVNIHGRPSNNPSVVVSLQSITLSNSIESYLGTTLYVKLPHMVEAKIQAISTREGRYDLKSSGPTFKKNESYEMKQWERSAFGLQAQMLEKGGIEIGPTTYMLHIRLREGFKAEFDKQGTVSQQPRWGSRLVDYPMQAAVRDIPVFRSNALAAGATVSSMFPKDAVVCYYGDPNFGSMGKVVSVNPKSNEVSVELTVCKHPALPAEAYAQPNDQYFATHQVARQCGISGQILGRLISNVWVLEGSQQDPKTKKNDIGLKIKFNKSESVVPGFAKRSHDQKWLLSAATVSIIQEYKRRFPSLFQGLERWSRERDFFVDDLFGAHGNGTAIIDEVKAWMKTLPTYKADTVPASTQIVSPASITMLENIQTNYAAQPGASHTMAIKVHPRFLQVFGYPDVPKAVAPESTYAKLGDRVVYINEDASCAVGHAGNIVGITGNKPEDTIDVVFDREVVKGSNLGGRLRSKGRGNRVPAYTVLNISAHYRTSGQKMPSVKVSSQATEEADAGMDILAAAMSQMANIPLPTFDPAAVAASTKIAPPTTANAPATSSSSNSSAQANLMQMLQNAQSNSQKSASAEQQLNNINKATQNAREQPQGANRGSGGASSLQKLFHSHESSTGATKRGSGGGGGGGELAPFIPHLFIPLCCDAHYCNSVVRCGSTFLSQRKIGLLFARLDEQVSYIFSYAHSRQTQTKYNLLWLL